METLNLGNLDYLLSLLKLPFPDGKMDKNNNTHLLGLLGDGTR